MELHPREQIWARRLAEAQSAKNELVRLLGLLNVLNNVTAREESLEVGAKSIALNLVSYLNLQFCGFYVLREKNYRLLAYSGEYPPIKLMNLIEAKIQKGVFFAQDQEAASGFEQVFCLPILNSQKHLGALTLLPQHRLKAKEKQHLRLAIEAIGPVLETFLLRNQLHHLNHQLGQLASRSLQKVSAFKRKNKQNQAYVENLLQSNPDPLFIIDTNGRLVRSNAALERLLGWNENYLKGKYLKKFLAHPTDWASVSGLLAQNDSLVEQEMVLKVHCGINVKARLFLAPLFSGKKMTGAIGRLRQAMESQPDTHSPVTMEEAMSLAHLSGQAIDHINGLLTAFRCHLQLLLLQDVLPPVRERLELLESLTQDQSGMIHKVQLCVDEIAQKCRKATSRNQLWQEPAASSGGQAMSDSA